jgi:hypothetical protein
LENNIFKNGAHAFVPKAMHFASAASRAKVIVWRLGASILWGTTFFTATPFQPLLASILLPKLLTQLIRVYRDFFLLVF